MKMSLRVKMMIRQGNCFQGEEEKSRRVWTILEHLNRKGQEMNEIDILSERALV